MSFLYPFEKKIDESGIYDLLLRLWAILVNGHNNVVGCKRQFNDLAKRDEYIVTFYFPDADRYRQYKCYWSADGKFVVDRY